MTTRLDDPRSWVVEGVVILAGAVDGTATEAGAASDLARSSAEASRGGRSRAATSRAETSAEAASAEAASQPTAGVMSRREHGRRLLAAASARVLGIAATDAASLTVSARCPDCGGDHGRPQLLGHPQLHLSLAHAGGWSFAAASARGPIGLDVEPLAGDPSRLAAIDEVAGATADPLRHWTRVEAVLKTDGRGLRVDPRLVRLTADDRASVLADVADRDARYRVVELDLGAAWCASLAVNLPAHAR